MRHLKNRWDKIKSNKKIFYSVLGGTGVVVAATVVAVPVALTKTNKNKEQQALEINTKPIVPIENSVEETIDQDADANPAAPSTDTNPTREPSAPPSGATQPQIPISPLPASPVEAREPTREEERQRLKELADSIGIDKLRLPIEVKDPVKRSQTFIDEVDFSEFNLIAFDDPSTGISIGLNARTISDDGTQLLQLVDFWSVNFKVHKDLEYQRTFTISGFLPRVVIKETITKANALNIFRSNTRDINEAEINLSYINKWFDREALKHIKFRNDLEEQILKSTDANIAQVTLAAIKQMKKQEAITVHLFNECKTNGPIVSQHLNQFPNEKSYLKSLSISNLKIKDGKYMAWSGHQPFSPWKEKVDSAIAAGCEVSLTEVERTDQKLIAELTIKKGEYFESKRITHWLSNM